jgi:hypothetical protein
MWHEWTDTGRFCESINENCQRCPIYQNYGFHKSFKGLKKCHQPIVNGVLRGHGPVNTLAELLTPTPKRGRPSHKEILTVEGISIMSMFHKTKAYRLQKKGIAVRRISWPPGDIWVNDQGHKPTRSENQTNDWVISLLQLGLG